MEKSYKILIADDEPGIRELLRELLKDSFYVGTTERGDEVIDLINKNKYDILILDLKLPGMSGIDILRKIHETKMRVVVVVITGSSDVEKAITSMKLGAYDYLVKPFDNEKFLVIIKNICERLDLEEELNELREQVGESFRFKNIIGKSPKMQKIFTTLEKVIDTDSTILVIGESGTGKEIIAKAVHYNSNRKQFPFRSIDCSTIPQELIGSELFGHEKGSFTGAISRKKGKFEVTSQGSIFLDEISNLSIDMQAKLLRVIQEKEFERIGGNEIIKVNTRVIAASNRDLRELVKEGRFREDLYYRLNVVPIYIPPLKERREDIPLFVDYFFKKYNTEYGRDVNIDINARILLSGYNWPGNVRQLENVIKRLILLSTKKMVSVKEVKSILEYEESEGPMNDYNLEKNNLNITDEDNPLLPAAENNNHEDSFNGRENSIKSMDQIEKEHLENVLRQLDYNISNAARALKISRKTMHNKLKKYNIIIKRVASLE